jgi:hypothetical protein
MTTSIRKANGEVDVEEKKVDDEQERTKHPSGRNRSLRNDRKRQRQDQETLHKVYSRAVLLITAGKNNAMVKNTYLKVNCTTNQSLASSFSLQSQKRAEKPREKQQRKRE